MLWNRNRQSVQKKPNLCWTGSLHSSMFGRWVLVSSLVWATIIGASLSLILFFISSMFFSISNISCRTCSNNNNWWQQRLNSDTIWNQIILIRNILFYINYHISVLLSNHINYHMIPILHYWSYTSKMANVWWLNIIAVL